MRSRPGVRPARGIGVAEAGRLDLHALLPEAITPAACFSSARRQRGILLKARQQ